MATPFYPRDSGDFITHELPGGLTFRPRSTRHPSPSRQPVRSMKEGYTTSAARLQADSDEHRISTRSPNLRGTIRATGHGATTASRAFEETKPSSTAQRHHGAMATEDRQHVCIKSKSTGYTSAHLKFSPEKKAGSSRSRGPVAEQLELSPRRTGPIKSSRPGATTAVEAEPIARSSSKRGGAAPAPYQSGIIKARSNGATTAGFSPPRGDEGQSPRGPPQRRRAYTVGTIRSSERGYTSATSAALEPHRHPSTREARIAAAEAEILEYEARRREPAPHRSAIRGRGDLGCTTAAEDTTPATFTVGGGTVPERESRHTGDCGVTIKTTKMGTTTAGTPMKQGVTVDPLKERDTHGGRPKTIRAGTTGYTTIESERPEIAHDAMVTTSTKRRGRGTIRASTLGYTMFKKRESYVSSVAAERERAESPAPSASGRSVSARSDRSYSRRPSEASERRSTRYEERHASPSSNFTHDDMEELAHMDMNDFEERGEVHSPYKILSTRSKPPSSRR